MLSLALAYIQAVKFHVFYAANIFLPLRLRNLCFMEKYTIAQLIGSRCRIGGSHVEIDNFHERANLV